MDDHITLTSGIYKTRITADEFRRRTYRLQELSRHARELIEPATTLAEGQPPNNALRMLPILENITELHTVVNDLYEEACLRAADTWVMPYRVIGEHTGRNHTALARKITPLQRIDKSSNQRRKYWPLPGSVHEAVKAAVYAHSLGDEVGISVVADSRSRECVRVWERETDTLLIEFTTEVERNGAGRRALSHIHYITPYEEGDCDSVWDIHRMIADAFDEFNAMH